MKSFATSICPIKKSSRSEYEASPHHPRTIPARQNGLLPNVGRFGAFFMDIEVLIGCSSRSSARRPCLQVLQSHLRVAKQSSIGPSARRPCPQIFQRHLRVADHPPTDLKTVSFRCHNRSSTRRPTHNYPRGDPVRDNPDRGDPGRGGNAHFADNPCLFTGKMVYLRPHNFRAG